MERRRFLIDNTLGAGLTALSASHVKGANDRVRVGVVGLHGRGRALLRRFSENPQSEVAYLCDVDENVFGPALKIVQEKGRQAPALEGDFRRLLENKSVDALVFALPVHWYALAVIWSCQAGKDVYVEKPVCHNITEGRLMVEAARKYGRVVQTGTQRRSGQFLKDAAAYAQSGKLGKIAMARAWMNIRRPEIGRFEDEPVPPGVNYDLWLGPAPKRAFNRNRFHYNWHWNWEYGAGELGNNGVHATDMVRALLGLGFPERVSSCGGLHVFTDAHQTPDTQVVTWQYPGLTVLYEQRQFSGFGLEIPFSSLEKCGVPTESRKAAGAYKDTSFGVALYGSEGTLLVYDNDWEVYHGDERVKHPGTLGEPEHIANFLDCIKTRARPNADIEHGYMAASLCHLGNIAFRTRRTLQFDAKSHRFVSDDEANGFLQRKYRPPFVVPEKV